MSKITINSIQTIIVTPDLKVRDLSDSNPHNPNKLRAIVDWQDEPVKILAGVHQYDAKIKDWKTVQALVDAKILTISNVIEEKETVKTKEKETKTSPKLNEGK